MHQNDSDINTWNKLAILYQEKFMDLRIYDATYDCFIDAIPDKKSTILDIACGPGNISRYILSKQNNFQLEGIDSSESMIKLASNNNPQAHYSILDCRQISTIKKTYSGIICGFILPYLNPDECHKFIHDCSELLKANGVLYLSLVKGNPSNSKLMNSTTGEQLFFNYHSLNHIEDELKQHQFCITNQFEIEYPKNNEIEIHTILIAIKTSDAL